MATLHKTGARTNIANACTIGIRRNRVDYNQITLETGDVKRGHREYYLIDMTDSEFRNVITRGARGLAAHWPDKKYPSQAASDAAALRAYADMLEREQEQADKLDRQERRAVAEVRKAAGMADDTEA